MIAKLRKIVKGRGGGRDDPLASLGQDIVEPEPEPAKTPAVTAVPISKDPLPAADGRWASIPNQPIDLDEFMAKFCEHRGKENRLCRKRALLAAARHGTVKLPALAGSRRHGQANKYLVYDLLSAWQGFIDEGVDLPKLTSEDQTRG